jgi:hypothetical protein
MKCRIETSATASEAATMTRSPARMPSSIQIGDTSSPATQSSRALNETSMRRRCLRARISIELGIDSLCRAEIPQVGGV